MILTPSIHVLRANRDQGEYSRRTKPHYAKNTPIYGSNVQIEFHTVLRSRPAPRWTRGSIGYKKQHTKNHYKVWICIQNVETTLVF